MNDLKDELPCQICVFMEDSWNIGSKRRTENRKMKRKMVLQNGLQILREEMNCNQQKTVLITLPINKLSLQMGNANDLDGPQELLHLSMHGLVTIQDTESTEQSPS